MNGNNSNPPWGAERTKPAQCQRGPGPFSGSVQPVPALVGQASYISKVLANASAELVRLEIAIDRMIGSVPETASDAKLQENSPTFEGQLRALADTADYLSSRIHRAAQRLDSAV